MSKPFMNRTILSLISITCLGILETTSLVAQAQTLCLVDESKRGESLNCANIYYKEGVVRVYQADGQESPEQSSLFITNTLETQGKSRGEVQFNEGSLAWSRSDSFFEFREGLDFGKVRKGTVLVAMRPWATRRAMSTPNTEIQTVGTVYILRYDPDTQESFIRVLGGKLIVSNRDGSQSVPLRAGQIVRVEQDFVGSPQSFDLQAFYQNKENPESELAEGFGPDQEDVVKTKPRSVQNTIYILRAETLTAVRSQTRNFPGRDYRREFLNDALVGTHDTLRGVSDDTRLQNPKQIADADSPLSATLRVEVVVDGDTFRVPFPGQLTEDGNFSFVTPKVEGIVEGFDLSDLPSVEVGFYVGTRNLTNNASIPTTQRFVDAVLTNPVIQDIVLRATGGEVDFRTLDRNTALEIVQSATVTPQGVPIPATTNAGTFIPIITDSGPVFVGPILDR